MKRIRRILRQLSRLIERRLRSVRARLPILQTLSVLGVLLVCAVLVLSLTVGRASTFSLLGTHADIWSIVVALCFLVALQMVVNPRIAAVVERRLSPGSYDDRQILFDLGQAARTISTIDELFEHVVEQVEEALRVTNVSIFVQDDESGDYVCRIASQQVWSGSFGRKMENRIANRLELSRDAFIVKRLRNLSAPLALDPGEFDAWSRSLLKAPPRSRATRETEILTLQCVQSRLLSQILMRNELIGIISIGPKTNGRAFTPEDKQLLTAVAGQLAFIIEHSKLVGRIVEEESLQRELALATEVQQRLFPECPPESEVLDLAGYCLPAREIGGDYYDFLRLDNGELGLAVADVAGKGIAAALLMSIVQASLRSQAAVQSQILGNQESLADLAGEMNRLLWRSTSSSSYVTFFYGQFNEDNRRFTYVNAGHNPPLLFREGAIDESFVPIQAGDSLSAVESLVVETRTGVNLATGSCASVATALDFGATDGNPERRWVRLSTGGIALGIFEKSSYCQESLELKSGDLLFAYTDGLTESLNTAGEEFGEARLKDALAMASQLSAAEVRDHIVDHVRAWSKGAPQHDDLTFIVVKTK